MLQALLSGVASIKAQQQRMNVIGDNLANVNTTAFKGSRVEFQDLMAQTLRGASAPSATRGGTDPMQVGMGVAVAGVSVNAEQGSMTATNRPTDLAIQGPGFFMVGTAPDVSYTRDGGLNLDANGTLVHRASGEQLMGWTASANGTIDTTVPPTSGLTIPLNSLTASQPTSRLSLSGNLNPAATPTDTWSVSTRVYDATGNAKDVTIRFSNRTAATTGGGSQWTWEALDGTTVLGSGTAAFDTAGRPTGTPGTFSVGGQAIALDLGSTQSLAGASKVDMKSQNGFGPGTLAGFSIGQDGVITGLFSNGMTRSIGQIATATFTNPGGLMREEGNLWNVSPNSGAASVGTPRADGHGGLATGYLEASNVDIGTEFTDLIVTQRAFQANTKVATTVDEMLQELMNLKR